MFLPGVSLTLSLEMQVCTQMYGRRPYGVGMLVAGYDVSHLGRERGRVGGRYTKVK